MSYTPEALRLADALENGSTYDVGSSVAYGWIRDDPTDAAAAELRRLHAENERLKAHIVGQTNRLDCELIPMAESLEAQRDALLGLCQELVKTFDMLKPNWASDEPSLIKEFRAAIAKVDGSQP